MSGVGWKGRELLRQIGDDGAVPSVQGGAPAVGEDLAELADDVGPTRHIGGIVEDGVAEQKDVWHGRLSLAKDGRRAAEGSSAGNEKATAVNHSCVSLGSDDPYCHQNMVGPRGVEPLDARRSVSQSAGLQPAERKGTRAGGPI